MKALKLFVVGCVMVAVAGLGASPAAADGSHSVGPIGFKLWPPSYAGCGYGGFTVYNDYHTASYSSMTISMQHSCTNPPGNASPANAGNVAAQAYLYRIYGGGSSSVCAWTLVHTNPQGDSTAYAPDINGPCGTGWHAVQPKWRITYGGTNYPDYTLTGQLLMVVP